MGIESGQRGRAAEAEKQYEAKMKGIKGNPGESRSDAEIRAQVEQELNQGVQVEK